MSRVDDNKILLDVIESSLITANIENLNLQNTLLLTDISRSLAIIADKMDKNGSKEGS